MTDRPWVELKKMPLGGAFRKRCGRAASTPEMKAMVFSCICWRRVWHSMRSRRAIDKDTANDGQSSRFQAVLHMVPDLPPKLEALWVALGLGPWPTVSWRLSADCGWLIPSSAPSGVTRG